MPSPERHHLSSPTSDRGSRTPHEVPRLERGGRQESVSFNLRRSELRPVVRSYVDNLSAQVQDLLRKQNVKTFDDLEFKLRYAVAKRQMSRDAAITIIQPVKELLARLKDVIKSGEIPEQREIRERLTKIAKDLQDKLNARLKHFHKGFFSKPEQVHITAPDLPPGLTQEHLDVINELYPGVFAERVLPTLDQLNNLDDAYVDAMYPKKQDKEDEKRGLISVRISELWNNRASADSHHTMAEVYLESMRVELQRIGGAFMLIEQTEACDDNSNFDGNYGSFDGKDLARDPFGAIIYDALDRWSNEKPRGRRSRMWSTIHNRLLHQVWKQLAMAFEDRNMTVPDFTISLVPAVIASQESTFYHPEWSKDKLSEYSSTILAQNGKVHPPHVLITGGSQGRHSGAACVTNQIVAAAEPYVGFRIAIIFKKGYLVHT